MPNPIKYKSVGVSIDAYDKLVYIADIEDRAIGRQLCRMIDDAYEEIIARNRPSTPPPRATNIGGLSAVLED